MMMAARVVSGLGGSSKSAGSVFSKGGSTATGTGAAASGFASGFASKFSPNSYVRDAVVEGGSNIGFGGGAGFMARAFGGIAARNGATLNGDSISSVASKAPGVSGSIGGEIADRSSASLYYFMIILNVQFIKKAELSGEQGINNPSNSKRRIEGNVRDNISPQNIVFYMAGIAG